MHGDIRELIADRHIQSVAIAVPNFLHAEMALAALQVGKDLLLKKSIALNYKEAHRVVAATRKSGCVLAIVTQPHFNRTYRQIIEAVKSGEI